LLNKKLSRCKQGSKQSIKNKLRFINSDAGAA